MKIIGIVAEYNPFHNGHLYQIETSKKALEADAVVAIMSGNFVQRGKPAFFNKWIRTKAAIDSGVNLVIELPTYFATASAERFAEGAITLLNQMGCIDYLSFGSESDDLTTLSRVASLLCKEPDEFKTKLKEELNKGVSFPKAREKAIHHALDLHLDFNKPNYILGIEYLKSLQKCNSSIKPFVVKRRGSGYHDTQLNTTFASATAIREQFIIDHHFDALTAYMPFHSLKAYSENLETHALYERFEDFLLYKLRSSNANHLKGLRDFNEGIEHKVIDAAMKSTNYQELVDQIKSKRYTETRVNRMLLSAFLDLPIVPYSLKEHGYIRVLGMDLKGQAILKKMKKNTNLPIITNINRTPMDIKANPLLQLDVKASNLYALFSQMPSHRLGGLDHLTKIYQKESP